jgi:hypothetical protein
MKKNKYLLGCLLLLFLAFSFIGCEPVTEDGSYVEPVSLYEKIGGEWNLSDLVVVDENSTQAKKEIPLSGHLGFDHFVLNLNLDAENKATSFRIETEAPRLIPTEGYWDLDRAFTDPFGASPVIILYSDAAKTNKTGTLVVMTVPGNNPEMELKITRSNAGKAYVSYVYKLKK